MKIAIYARYSSTLQDSRSVDDQVRVCRERAEREGWDVGEVFADYAISGSVRQRPGLNAMLAAAGDFDIVLAEAIDRISRDQEDIAGIWKALRFADCQLVTLSEGEISELHIGLKGTMAALFRKDLADKIRRGQRGRVAAGRIPGGIVYGYRKIVRIGTDGEPERGLREIDPDQAEIVRRIYREFLAGLSPRDIAGRLNEEGVAAPRGKVWRMSMINGDRVRRNGILQNEIYIGRLIYNRTRMVQDPATRRRVPRVNPESEWMIAELPELRIVDQADWDAVRARRKASDGWDFRHQRRPKRLLSGLVRCGVCGGGYTVIGTDLWGCSRRRDAKACENHRVITTAALESRVLAGLRQHLLDPEFVRIFVREYHQEYARRTAAQGAARGRLERRLTEARAKVDRIVAAFGAGGHEFEEIRALLAASKDERERLERELAELDALPVIALHPNLAGDYRRNVEQLSEALATDPDARLEAVPAIRSLIDEIVITPAAQGRGVDIEMSGRLANIIALATGKPLRTEVDSPPMLQMVAEEGLEPPTRGL